MNNQSSVPEMVLTRFSGIATRHKIGLPRQIYPLYENGYRAHQGQSVEENHKESVKLYADFAKVAQENMYSWQYGEQYASEKIIGVVCAKNRMICSPCKFMLQPIVAVGSRKPALKRIY